MNTAQHIRINLLDKDPFLVSSIGKLLVWALSVGRYIVIFTELIVIFSFLSRFTLDRKLTDLNSQIERQKSIIKSYGSLETEVRDIQKRLDIAKQKTDSQTSPRYMEKISRVLPQEVKLEQVIIDANAIRINANALSQYGLNQFIVGLGTYDDIRNITVTNIEFDPETNLINFDVRADLGVAKTQKTTKK